MKQNQSRLIKLLVVLIVVFAIFVLKNEMPRYFPQKVNQLFSSIKKGQINEVILTKNQAVRIYKKNNNWYVKKDNNEFKAERERVEKIIDSFLNLKKENIVSNNKNKHKELGIDKQKIEIKAGGKTYVIYLGNTDGLSNNYIRIENEDDVFKAEVFEDAFTSDDYRDLSLGLINDENKVTSVIIGNSDSSVSLVKNKNDWKIGEKIAKKDRVEFYLNDLKTLKAQDILNKKENFSTVNLELTVNIKENNKEKSISFYPENEEAYLAIVTSSDFDYLIPTAYVASLKKEEKDFLE